MRIEFYPRRVWAAWTLLELVIVVSIIAALSGSSILLMDDTEVFVKGHLAQAEMAQVREALLAFKRDTGYMPREGPFALVPDGGAVPVPPGGAAWFKSPANFVELFENPLEGTGHALEVWDPETQRGWHGPYLTQLGEGLVDVGDGLASNGTGNPALGNLLNEVYGVADQFEGAPVGSFFVWRAASGAAPYSRWGRPYFLFDATDPDAARLVSSGFDLTYDQGTNDDIVVYLFK